MHKMKAADVWVGEKHTLYVRCSLPNVTPNSPPLNGAHVTILHHITSHQSNKRRHMEASQLRKTPMNVNAGNISTIRLDPSLISGHNEVQSVNS